MNYQMVITKKVTPVSGYADACVGRPQNVVVAIIQGTTFRRMAYLLTKWVYRHVPDISEKDQIYKVIRDAACDTSYRKGDLTFNFRVSRTGSRLSHKNR